MTTFLTILHVFVCLVLISVVLLQSGRAGGMGVLSGAATQTVFGGRGAGGFLQKLTAVCAILFMLTCSTLAWMASSARDHGLRSASSAPTASPAAAHPAAHPPATPPAAPSAPVAPAAAAPTAPVEVPAPTEPAPTNNPAPTPPPAQP